ncbi:MAG: DUF6787 family protein [Chitinophagaceae bacterium]
MFQRLQQKWKVNGFQLILILCTFAIGGSLTGIVGKKLMNLFQIDQRGLWLLIYIIVVTLVWPFAVMLISVPFGQYQFFAGYLAKMGRRIGLTGKRVQQDTEKSKYNDNLGLCHGQGKEMIHIAIFASGAGSNAKKIIDHFKNSDHINISLVVCNKPGAGVSAIAANENIPSIVIDKDQFFRGDAYTGVFMEKKIGFIVLAGFLWKIPDKLIEVFPGKIINIHPALLPGFGGKGMYGNYVHEAVIAAGEKESGITIHFVDGHYDNGDIIFQAKCHVYENDTAATLAERIHMLEYEHYPRVIEKLLSE